ncbi:hypothetical protein [Streptomyces sp. NPDC048277]|uniref:hypothetical protein n=1 Tax=Streptomyces sp. NPDC048277 TaxID=3155027 RepID=UPI0033CF8631
MADGTSFEVDPDQVTSGSSLITELGSFAWDILGQFNNVMADTSWTGTDSNGHKIRDNFVQNRDSTTNTLTSLAQALERTGEATIMNLNAAQGTQDDIIDGINEQSGEYGARRG